MQSWPSAEASALYRNPSVTIDGPDALLARAVEFRTLLDGRQRDVVWFMTGEKLLTGDPFRSGEESNGRLELSGAGCFADGQWHEWHAARLNRGSGVRRRVAW